MLGQTAWLQKQLEQSLMCSSVCRCPRQTAPGRCAWARGPGWGRHTSLQFALWFFWNSLSHVHVTFTHRKRLTIKLFKNLKSMNSVIIIKCVEAPWQCTREAVLRGQRSSFSNIRLILSLFCTFLSLLKFSSSFCIKCVLFLYLEKINIQKCH